jgi:transposase
MITYTVARINELQREALKELIEEAGSGAHLAKMIGVPASTVQGWVNRGRISKRGAIKVQRNSHLCNSFPVEKLRPDSII